MDGILSDGRTGKLWLCKKKDGHALGIVLRVRSHGVLLDRLLLFREAVDFDEPSESKLVHLPADVKTMGFAEGTYHDIPCSVCEAERTWYMGEASLERFIEARKRVKDYGLTK